MAISDLFPEIWEKEMQEVLYKSLVAEKIADMMNGSEIKKYGDTVHRPYRAPATIQRVTRGVDLTPRVIDANDETMVINEQRGDLFQVTKFDQVQSMYDMALNYGKDSGQAIAAKIDADVLAEVVNSGSVVDTVAIGAGGTAGDGVVLTAANVIQVMSTAKMLMRKKNVTSTDVYGAVSPEFINILTQAVAARATTQGDTVGENGYIGNYYGVDFYETNNLTASAELALSVQPTAGETITISGVPFQFVSTIGAVAGNVLIGADVDATRANLATLINAPATTTATGVALSTANALRFTTYFSAVNNNTTDVLTVTGRGQSVLTVAETMANAANVWTVARQLQRNLFGIKGNPVCVIQSKPSIVERLETKQETTNYITSVLYKTKTFIDNAPKMVDVRLASSTYLA